MCRLAEPTIEELLRDPIAQVLMERDGLRPEQVRSCLRAARIKQLAAVTGCRTAEADSNTELEEKRGAR